MKLLFCVEFYYPSLGGAQEVVRHLAERMAARGHQVSVATSRIKTRNFLEHKRVRIEEFEVSGNQVRGFEGDIDRYRGFLIQENFDIVFFYAAQQWTFDAAWLVMDRIRGKKILVPCGYSGLNNPAYAFYFASLPDVLRKLDHLVYHAADYRDVAFGRTNGLDHSSMIPNGADSEEFSVVKDAGFRARHGIPEDAVALLTVGTVTGLKGHAEVLDAFERASFSGRTAVLFLNGNEPEWNGEQATLLRTVRGLARQYGWRYALKYATKKILWNYGLRVGNAGSVKEKAVSVNRRWDGSKRVIACDLPRPELIQAYLNADLFVFASNVEYSPLVLFEACAAGLPFVSVPVGNSSEIAEWTSGGEICPADKDAQGYTRVSPDELARRMEALVADKERCSEMGRHGRSASRERFNWNALSREYEALFSRLTTGSLPVSEQCGTWPPRKSGEAGSSL